MKRDATRPAARLPGAGWVWVLYEGISRWDVWQTFPDGSTRLELQKVSADEYAARSAGLQASTAEAVCSRGAANLGAGFFTISGASSHASVWVAYSRHPWAPQVLRDHASDAHGKRALHMTHLTPKAWLGSGALPANCTPLTAANLAGHVADYGALPASGDARMSPLVRGFENASRPLRGDRLGLAAKMETQARTFEKAAGPTCHERALIVRLRDDLGVAEELNHLVQLACELKKAWAIGGPDWNGTGGDPERAWKLTSSVHVSTIEQWAVASAHAEVRQAVSRAMHKGLPPITEEDFQAGLTDGRIKAGSTWSPLYIYELNGQPRLGPDGKPMEQTIASRRHPERQTRLGRMQLPSQQVQTASARRGKGAAEDRVERYRERLDMPALDQFKRWFDEASARWDRDHLAPFDNDRIAWRETAALKSSLQVLFDPAINLCKPEAKRGTPVQQVADVGARLAAIDAMCGGGAVSAVSAKNLRTMLDKPPGDPTNWFTHGLLAPFGYVQAILEDKDKQKDSAENFKGLLELPSTMRQAVSAYGEKRLEESLHGVLAARLQAVQHKAAALDELNAKALGVAKTTPAQVMGDYKLHVRLTALMDEVVTPHNPFMSFRVRLPLGATLDALADGMGQGQLPVDLEAKSSSHRSERRQQQVKLRKLEGKPGLTQTIDYPVTLRRDELVELQRLARLRGEALVQVLPDQTLGTLSRAIELPDSVARRLVADQITTGRQWAKAALSMDGLGSGVVFVFQLRALMDAMGKIETAEGYEYADALMAIFSAVSGMTEVAATLGALAYQVKVEAGRPVLVRTVTTAAALRAIAGIAGAAAAGFDGFAAHAKSQSRKARGDATAATAYAVARNLYGTSAGTLLLGALAMWKANSAFTAEQISKGMILRFFGTRSVALAFGTWITGIGVVLSIAGFAWSLYALSLEDDLNEVFLKRSHWGTKDSDSQRTEGRFSNLEAEAMAFKSLSVGVKATLEWNDNWFSSDTVSAKVEMADWQDENKLERSLSFDGAGGGLSKTWDHPALTRNDAGRHEFLAVIKIPNGATGAAFSYRITDSTGRVTIAGDNLKSKDD